jgi:hypothetical protein
VRGNLEVSRDRASATHGLHARASEDEALDHPRELGVPRPRGVVGGVEVRRAGQLDAVPLQRERDHTCAMEV